MCGIVGCFKFGSTIQNEDVLKVKSSLILLSHRGPDSYGCIYDDKIVFGHTRLSIIDLSTDSNQPFSRKDLGLSIVFNGEIYNYKILKKLLENEGFIFFTDSDTEVLLVGFKHYGKEICTKLLGMFSFSIYDHVKQEFFAARDRFGEKPFFYILDEKSFYFSSELKALKSIYPHELVINHSAVIDLFENLYINMNHTIYDNVNVLKPGQYFSCIGTEISISTYYSIPTKVEFDNDFINSKSKFNDLLHDSVASQLIADVPVASFLSSGIDSSLIAGIAHKFSPDITVFTMSTGEKFTDEAESSKKFCRLMGINQEIVNVDSKSLRGLIKILGSNQPLSDSSLIPTFLVTEFVKDKFKVMLGGDGGDEVFGSYRAPNLYKSNYRGINFFGNLGLDIVYNYFPLTYSKISDKNRIKYGGWKNYYRRNFLLGFYDQIFKESSPQNFIINVLEEIENNYHDSPEKLSFGLDFHTRLPADFLFKIDSASMQNSVEVRSPFLDFRLVDFSLKSSLSSLMPNGIDKELTRSLFKDLTGYEHLEDKKGFSIPFAKYLLKEWGDLLENLLNERLSENYFKFNVDGILKLLQTFRSNPSQNVARILFTMLVLEIWLREFHLNIKIPYNT
jgi:asparagine synthase (glutamine-hydrolysing)